jgi:hypothetical protein
MPDEVVFRCLKTELVAANQIGSTIIPSFRVGLMSFDRQSRSDARARIWVRALLAPTALLALLVARNSLPDFPRAPSVHSAVSVVSHHDQRPRFDYHGSQWSAPADRFLPLPPVAESFHLASLPQLFSKLQNKRVRYNRPPPLS